MAQKRMTPAKAGTAEKAAAKKTKTAKAVTKPTKLTVSDFIAGIADAKRRAEAGTLVKIFDKATGWQAQMWGPSIIGYGRYSYTYESGRQGDSCVLGFSPQPQPLARSQVRSGSSLPSSCPNGGSAFFQLALAASKILNRPRTDSTRSARRSGQVPSPAWFLRPVNRRVNSLPNGVPPRIISSPRASSGWMALNLVATKGSQRTARSSIRGGVSFISTAQTKPINSVSPTATAVCCSLIPTSSSYSTA